MMLLSALWTLLLVTQLPPCAVTPTVPLLPGIVDRATGIDPAWLATDNPITWTTLGMKTLWVFKVAHQVRVSGREVTTGAVVRFQRGFDNPIYDVMTIDDPRRESVLPGGADPHLLDTFTFHPSAVFYPNPGCYRFQIDVDHTLRHIAVQVR